MEIQQKKRGGPIGKGRGHKSENMFGPANLVRLVLITPVKSAEFRTKIHERVSPPKKSKVTGKAKRIQNFARETGKVA